MPAMTCTLHPVLRGRTLTDERVLPARHRDEVRRVDTGPIAAPVIEHCPRPHWVDVELIDEAMYEDFTAADEEAAVSIAVLPRSPDPASWLGRDGRTLDTRRKIGDSEVSREGHYLLLGEQAPPYFADDPVELGTVWIALDDRVAEPGEDAGALVVRQRRLDQRP